ncbi:MAG: hypothetical protein MR691_14860 [Clostridium sp.]|nr:hypothetical protein [Clostridium sp.]
MASINIDDEKRLIVSIKDISSLDTSIGENQTVTTDTSDINYIPGYVASEEERRANEIQRVENENEREAYYEEIQKKVANGEFKGEKGDKGEKGEDGLTIAISVNGSNYTHDNGLITLPDYPIVPTNVSQLNNDSNFISDSNYVHTDNNYTSEEKEKVAVIDKSGNGTKYLSDDGTYKTVSGEGGTSDYNGLKNKPSINNIELVGNKTLNELGFEVPTKTSDLENNSGFITNAEIPSNISSFNNDIGYITSIPDEYVTETELTSKGYSTFSGSYNDLTNKPTIPTKTSDLTNDSEFISSIPSEYITEAELSSKGYLTSIPDTYKTKTENDTLYQPKGTYLTEEQDPTVPSYVKTITEQNITDWNNKSDFSGSYNDLTNLPVFNEIKKIMPDIYTASNPFIFHGIETGMYQIVAGAYYKYNTDDVYQANDNDMYLMCVMSRSDMCNFYLFSNDILSISTYESGGYGYSSKTPSITNIRLNGSDLTPVNGTVAINTATKISDLTNDSGFISSIPSEYVTDEELTSKGYLTEHQDISGKVDKIDGKGLSTNDYTAEEKTKLAGIEVGAEVNTVTSVNSQTGDVNIAIPSKISDLTNDSGFLTSYTETDPVYTADKPNIALKSELFSKDYNDLTNVPSIPTKVSELENDSNFINSYTETDPLYMADKPDIAFKNEIPANTSDLYNDSNYVSDENYVHTDNNYTTEDMNKLNGIKDYVIECGSNANGFYEKYANGTLKQWGKVTVTNELKTAHGSTGWYRTASEQFITHPIPFVGETPVVNLMAQAALNFAYISTNNLDKSGFYPLTSYSAAGATRYVHWTAIGKWK